MEKRANTAQKEASAAHWITVDPQWIRGGSLVDPHSILLDPPQTRCAGHCVFVYLSGAEVRPSEPCIILQGIMKYVGRVRARWCLGVPRVRDATL